MKKLIILLLFSLSYVANNHGMQKNLCCTSLHDAALSRHDHCFSSLIKNPDLINARNHTGETPLHIIVQGSYGDQKVLTDLLKEGADLSAKDDNGDTPLHHAAGHGQLAYLQLLLQAGAREDEKNNLDDTPLHIAAQTFRNTERRLLKCLLYLLWWVPKTKTEFLLSQKNQEDKTAADVARTIERKKVLTDKSYRQEQLEKVEPEFMQSLSGPQKNVVKLYKSAKLVEEKQ